MDELISIIVPVYKVESFLDHCISSIVNQTYKNLEIILVDDGSPDKSGNICDAWAKRDNRIRVIHKKNGGSGQARNIALSQANGKFISFVDSDDYIAPIFYEYIFEIFEDGYDIVECEYLETTDNNACFDILDEECSVVSYNCDDAMKEHIEDKKFRQLIWNKLYRKSVVEGIKFPEDKMIDDEFWTYQVLGRARKLKHSDKKLYAYRQQNASVMHSMNLVKRLQAIEAKCLRHDYISMRFLELKSYSNYNLWFTFLYQCQLALRASDKQDKRYAINYINTMAKKYPVQLDENFEIPYKNKVWIWIAQKNLVIASKIRNLFRIGL